MNSGYDVIVIGAGNAGLAAAAYLNQSGIKTLVIERNSLPGGCATSFVRGRFEFEPSLHEMANVGTEENPGSVRKMFESLGAEVTWVNEANAFRVIALGEDGFDVTMPSGVEAFCDELERQCKGSRESALALFELAEKANAALGYISQGKPDPAVLMKEHTDFLRMAAYSVDECLNALNMPLKAQSIVKTYWPYLGAATDSLDMAHYLIMMSRYISGSPAMPYMKSHELSLALEKVIRQGGGEIWYNTEVTKILTENGKACGVVADGKEIYSRFVVANCFPETAYGKMINPSDVPVKGVKLSNARKKGELFFTVYLGLNKSAEELNIKDYSVFIYGSADSMEQYRSMDNPEKSFVIANCLNRTVSDASPQGTCTMFLTTMLSQKGWGEVTPNNYKKVKQRIARRMIKAVESSLGIRVSPYIEEIAIATPSTFAGYLNTPLGTPYGYEVLPWDTMIARIINGKNEQFTENLFFVGAHGDRADGYSSAYSNGSTAAKRIIREVKANEQSQP